MATDKKSVLLYCDIIHTVRELSDDEAGKLFKHYLSYVNDENPTAPDKLTMLLFEPIKQNLKRDLKKYESIIEKRSKAGLASAESKKQTQQVSTSVESVKHNPTLSTVKDTVTVKDKVKDIKEEVKLYASFQHLKLTYDEFDKLIACGFNKKQIDDTIESIQNYKKNTNYVSLYLTLKKWLKKDKAEITPTEKPFIVTMGKPAKV